MRFRALLPVATVGLATFLAVGGPEPSYHPQTKSDAAGVRYFLTPRGYRIDVEPLFEARCAGCHGIDGRSGHARVDLTCGAFTQGDQEKLYRQFEGAVRRGNLLMPGQAGLERSEMERLYRYLSKLHMMVHFDLPY